MKVGRAAAARPTAATAAMLTRAVAASPQTPPSTYGCFAAPASPLRAQVDKLTT
uniref:Uncharacterized protein n=1 Tax=Arundo donax TaxID=35708 RepID=A0A0A9HL87_ARUDO